MTKPDYYKYNRKDYYDDNTAVARVFPEKECKAVWANYLNMARQNMYQTICHISHCLGLDYDNDKGEPIEVEENKLIDSPVVKALQESENAETKQKVMDMLDKHLPFLSPMLERQIELRNKETRNGDKSKTPKDYHEVLEMILPLLNLLRNKYTHYRINDKRLDADGNIINAGMIRRCRELSKLIDYCATGARRIVKERFSVGENSPLRPADFDFLEGKARYFNNGKKEKKERKDFKYRVFDEERGISNIGLFMLVCMMLTKKYASEFADQMDFFQKKKSPGEKEIKIMREIISVYRIRLPKERIESTQQANALGLDMLNELKKCPRELFDTLSPTDREKFRVESDGDNVDGVLLKRSSDRFPYLALRYLDDMRLFKDIRFQVSLGDYRFKFYRKQWIDGADPDDRIRILQKSLTGFGRIDEIECKRNEVWGDKILKGEQPRCHDENTRPYVTDHRASYLISNNRIGMYWNEKDKSGIVMPSLELPDWLDGYPQNSQEICGMDDKATIAKCQEPLCFISVHELPAMAFLAMLIGGDKVEALIKDKVKSYHDFYNDISAGNLIPYDKETKRHFIPEDEKKRIKRAKNDNGHYSYVIDQYGIDFSDIPAKLQEYLLGECPDLRSRFTKLAKMRLQKMLEDTESRLEKFSADIEKYGTSDNKIGKVSHVDLRPGVLARWLAEDMVRFKEADENGRIKLTGQNFNILQAELAQYRLGLNEFTELLKNAELVDCEREHPFLGRVLEHCPTSFFKFYEYYLVEKRKMLIQWTNMPKAQLGSLYFLYPDRMKWKKRDKEYYRELAMRYHSIELPRGMFLDAIKSALKNVKVPHPEYIRDALALPRCNVSYLIMAYHKALNDGCQAYYDMPRCYKYFSMSHNPEWDFGGRQITLKDKYLKIDERTAALLHKDQAEDIYMHGYEEMINRRIADGKKKAERIGRRFNAKAVLGDLENERDAVSGKLQRLRVEMSENEKKIRQYMVEDILLFHIGVDILTKSMQDTAKIDLSQYKLRNLGRDDNDILSVPMPFAITLQIKDKDETRKEVTIHQDDLKLKNYGDFFKFVYDSRIATLLERAKGNEFSREMLDNELNKYDEQRIPLFEVIHDFERRIWDRLPSEKRAVDRIDFKYLTDYVDFKDLDDRTIVEKIRNAFSHNSYPTDMSVKIIYEKSDIPEIAPNLFKLFKRKIDDASLK